MNDETIDRTETTGDAEDFCAVEGMGVITTIALSPEEFERIVSLIEKAEEKQRRADKEGA